MNPAKFVIALTLVNLTLLIFTAAQARPPSRDIAPVIRAHSFELADDRGVLRSRLEVKPDGAVLLQLFDQKGVIKVKLGAGEDGSGLFLADETTQSGVQIIARQGARPDRKTTGITLTGKDGLQRSITLP